MAWLDRRAGAEYNGADVELMLPACACGIDPASEVMALQTGLAAALTAPYVLRHRIAGIVRRMRRGHQPAPACEDEPVEARRE